MIKHIKVIVNTVFLAIILAGCGSIAQSKVATLLDVDKFVVQSTATSSPREVQQADVIVDTDEDTATSAGVNSAPIELPQLEKEFAEGEYRWSQLLARDAIRPVYEPEFAPADQAPYVDDELVIGVEINGESKAYAIGPLNSREMVNDSLGGIPILVTW